MKIAVHYTEGLRNDNFAFRWIEALETMKVEVVKLNFYSPKILQEVRNCDAAMWHWIHTPMDKQVANKVLYAIETVLGKPVFPNHYTRWHYDDKLSQYYLFEAVDVPKVKTWVFWDYDQAMSFIKKAVFPLVFKLSVGAGSANVLKVEDYHEAKALVKKMFKRGFFPYTINEFKSNPWRCSKHSLKEGVKRGRDSLLYFMCNTYPQLPSNFLPQKNYVYFQEFIPYNPYDIRITVIGDKAFGYTRHNRENDFRASGSGNPEYDINMIPIQAVKIAHTLSKELAFQSMAYDFLRDMSGNLLLGEISYCYVNHMVFQCPGYWDRTLSFHEGHMWPEEAQVRDFVEYVQDRTGRK